MQTKRMRRIFAAVMVIAMAAACLVLTSCNRQFLDTTYKFGYAYIALPDGNWIAGPVESWADFQDGDQLQIVIHGITYLTHASNVVLCTEKPA